MPTLEDGLEVVDSHDHGDPFLEAVYSICTLRNLTALAFIGDACFGCKPGEVLLWDNRATIRDPFCGFPAESAMEFTH
jgi:hypothetical protein